MFDGGVEYKVSIRDIIRALDLVHYILNHYIYNRARMNSRTSNNTS
jgi:hypothetical protein